jgi:hypothetical protein
MARTVAVVAGLLLLLAGCGDGSSSAPATAPEGPATVTGSFRCPDPHADPSDVVDDGSDTLSTGARAARLCLRDNNTPWTPPRGTLTTGLDSLVGVVNAQEVHHPAPDEACGGVGAPAWTMVFRYDDGIRTISGDNGGCWDLLVGRTERVGSQHAYEAFLGALVRQRAHEHPRPFHRAPPACPVRLRLEPFDPIADASTALVASLCVLNSHQRTTRRVALTSTQLATLRDDFATAPQRATDEDAMSRCPADPPPALVVRGLDAWREPFDIYVECGVYRILRPGDGRYRFATFLPRTEQMLTGLESS